MTPTASRLQIRIDDRRQWFVNQWFFKWHATKTPRGAEIDTFDGRQAKFAGLHFEGTIRDVYWSSITRGVRKEISDLYQWVENDVRQYPHATAAAAIDECGELISSLVQTLRDAAASKDRILRGNGVEFPPIQDAGDWHGTSREEVLQYAADLKRALFPPGTTTQVPAARTAVGRAVQANRSQSIFSIASLEALVNERIAALESQRPNDSIAMAKREQELTHWKQMRTVLVQLREVLAEYQSTPAVEPNLEATANAFSRGVQAWWEKRSMQVCDSASELAMFSGALAVCAAVGAPPAISVPIAALLFGRKAALKGLIELAKKTLRG